MAKANVAQRLLVMTRIVGSAMHSYATGSSTVNLRDTTDRQLIAQTFTATATQMLAQARFRVSAFQGSPTGTMYYELRDGATLTNVLAVSSTIDVSTITPGGFTNLHFHFQPYYWLESGVSYALVAVYDGVIDGINYLKLAYNTTSVYSGGSAYTYDGATWTEAAGDFYFRIDAGLAPPWEGWLMMGNANKVCIDAFPPCVENSTATTDEVRGVWTPINKSWSTINSYLGQKGHGYSTAM
jgi:hypothetical protein